MAALKSQLEAARLHAELEEKATAAEAAESEFEALREDIVRLASQTKAWRDVGSALWKTIGQLVGSELSVPWLKVDEMRLLIGYRRVAGEARLALEDEPTEWRDLDQAFQMSTGEISEAFLHLFLTRVAELGQGHHIWPIVTIPWHVLTAIVNQDRLAGLDKMFKKAGVVGIGEVPRPGKLRIIPVTEL